MCDKSLFGKIVGRFDKNLVETYRGPANVETAPVTTGTDNTMTGSGTPDRNAERFPLNRFGEKIDYTIYCP